MTTFIAFLLAISSSFNATEGNSFHNYSIDALNSEGKIHMSDFKGKKILVVNVASKCGYTPQYEGLQKLFAENGEELVVIGFPCDQFMGQELNTEEAIEEFCTSKFEVTFPMTTIVNVKGGDQHPIYQWLTKEELNGKSDHKITWNFNKFLISEEGELLEYFPSKVKPMDYAITKYFN